ncbi:MAG: GAF domain-containing protein [Myxococcales bacterium]|nr:GAF domain-containing protein [Myxococcales bacterium]
MKPEVSAALFMPLVEQCKESDVSLERWNSSASKEESLPLEKRWWIDEVTFRELIAVLGNLNIEKLKAVGARFLKDESNGLGDLLFPFVDDPHHLLDALAEQINYNARTLRLTLHPGEKNSFTATLVSTLKRPAPPVLGWWLEGILRAAQELIQPFDFKRQDVTNGHADELIASMKKAEAETNACAYQISWKKTFFSRTPKSTDRLEHARESMNRARKAIVYHRQQLAQTQLRLASEEALLHGIVSLSEATKTVKTYRELIHLTANRICTDLGFDRCQIYLAREGQLEIVSVIDPLDMNWAQTIFATVQANPIPLDDRTEESRSFQSGKYVIVNNPWNNIFVPQVQQEAWKSKGYLIVPIRGADRIIGLVLADHYYKRLPIEPDDVDKLQAVANISGMAIEKLRLIDKLETKVTERTGELERANKKLMVLYEKARETDRIKSDFLANMSHELRTPLNSIIGFSKIILRGIDGPLTDRQQTDISAILNSGTHLLSLINDILDLSKIESGRMELQMADFSLQGMLHEVETSARILLKDKPIELVINIDPALDVVFGDRMRLHQVMLNLVSNASKFTEKGQITITSKRGSDSFYIAVSDTGMGIPADKINLVFERFRQLDSSSSRVKGGSGLGLTISKKFVEMHGGRIWVTSTEGVGSTFHISIPYKVPTV